MTDMTVEIADHSSQAILVDSRWAGDHGIGRFTTEVLTRLKNVSVQTEGPKPLSLLNLLWQPYFLWKKQTRYRLYFNPGFNPLLYSPMPFIFMLHDLNHLHFPNSSKFLKKIYYQSLIKYTARRALKILTPSEYSKQTILEWTGLSENKIKVVSSGVSSLYTTTGLRFEPGYSYLLNVGNTKTHKNISRLLQAFAKADINTEIKLVLTGEKTQELAKVISNNQLENRIVFSGHLTEEKLSEYYRGALGVVFPSLYEGFGLPVVEAMASGVPLLTSNVTSLPEIAGDAALLVDPYQIDSIAEGIRKLVTDMTLRSELVEKGLARAKLYTWERTAKLVQAALDEKF